MNELPDPLKLEELPIALNWVEENFTENISESCFNDFIKQIISAAWQRLEEKGVLEALIRVILCGIKSYQCEEILNRNADDNKRRMVLDAIPTILLEIDKTDWHFYNLVSKNDFWWLIEKLDNTDKDKIWASMIDWAFDRADLNQINALITASKSYSAIAIQFNCILNPVELLTPEAEKMKERYEKLEAIKRRNEKDEKKKLLIPSPLQRVYELLNQFEEGDLEAWWRINMEMTLKPDSTHYGDELEHDLTALPVWNSADDNTKNRIITAAKKYLIEKEVESNDWILDNTLHCPAFAGYRAFQLLLKEEIETVWNLPESVWGKWAPTILAYPSVSGGGNEAPHHLLVKLAYNFAPDEIIQTLLTLIDKENEGHGYLSILRRIEDCWDNNLEKILFKKLRDGGLKASTAGDLLSCILKMIWWNGELLLIVK